MLCGGGEVAVRVETKVPRVGFPRTGPRAAASQDGARRPGRYSSPDLSSSRSAEARVLRPSLQRLRRGPVGPPPPGWSPGRGLPAWACVLAPAAGAHARDAHRPARDWSWGRTTTSAARSGWQSWSPGLCLGPATEREPGAGDKESESGPQCLTKCQQPQVRAQLQPGLRVRVGCSRAGPAH